MKNKALVIISVLMLCIVLFSGFYPVKVSAAESFDYSVFKGTDFSKFTQEYCNSTLDSMVKPYDDYKDLEKSGLLETGEYFCSSYEDFKFGALPNNFLSRFLLSMERANRFYSSELSINKPIYYMFYEFTYTDSNNKKNLGYNWILSNSKFEFVSNSSDSSIINLKINGGVYDCNVKSLPFGSTIGWNNSGKSESFLYFAFNKSNLANFVDYNINGSNNGSYRNYYSENNYNFCGLYSNFEIPGIDLFDNIPDNVFSDGFSDPSLKGQIDVKLTPEFGMNMDIKKDYDDRIGFSVTNNSDSPIQFLAYIDTPDNKDYFSDDYENKVVDYELSHCIIEPAYEKAIWNYEIEDYYYSLDFSNDSKKLGFQQKCKIDTSKCYGATVFIYLDSGQTYTDNVYWKNIHMSTGKEYRMNFLAFPLTVDTATNIFDIEKYKNEDVLTVFGDKILKQLHWWTLDYKVSISEIAQIYNVDYSSGVFLYQQNFSLVSIPTYSPTSVGGKGLISQGFANDSALNDKLYDYNMDTGNETFNNMSSDKFSVNVDVDNISVDNVKEYINYSTNFFGLIKGTLSTFPTFIWALIFFGLTAFVVIALIKWILP